MDITCIPFGATVSSSTDGIVASTMGVDEGRPRRASSKAASMVSIVGQIWMVPRCCGPASAPGSAVKFGSALSARLILQLPLV